MFESHLRVSALGTLPGGEIFSFGVALDKVDRAGDPWQGFLDPNSTQFDDIANDVAQYWNNCPLSSGAVLKSVKIASIGPDGKYTSPPVERAISAATAGAVGGAGPTTHVTNQTALAVTLLTAGDLGRVKGRYYLPMPAAAVGSDGRIGEAQRDNHEALAATFIRNLNNEPGIDMLNLQVVVASQGRRNKDGSVRLPPRNYPVTAVAVGRVLDTQRRRRNKVREIHGTPTNL